MIKKYTSQCQQQKLKAMIYKKDRNKCQSRLIFQTHYLDYWQYIWKDSKGGVKKNKNKK